MKVQQIKRNNKRINLRVWMIVKILPSLFLFTYYCMGVRRYFQPIYIIIQYALIGSIIIFLIIIRNKCDVFDEFARETLYKTDSICLNIAYIFMGFMLLPCLFITPNAIMIGYLIAGGIVVLSIIRTIIFCVIDSQGM